jgi:hypothetical protein
MCLAYSAKRIGDPLKETAPLIRGQLEINDPSYLVGHKVSGGLDINHDRTSEVDMLAEYLKVVDLLTINSDNRLKNKIHQLELASLFNHLIFCIAAIALSCSFPDFSFTLSVIPSTFSLR